jgi:hypothetical protein
MTAEEGIHRQFVNMSWHLEIGKAGAGGISDDGINQ